MSRTYLRPEAEKIITELQGHMENDTRPEIILRSLRHTQKILHRWIDRPQRRLYSRITRTIKSRT